MGISFSRSFSEQPVYTAKVWDIFSYPSDNWTFFGTDQGVVAFDGNSWLSCNLNNESEIRCVEMDYLNGRLLVGGINEFGYILPDKNGLLKYNCLSDELDDLIYIGNIWEIHEFGSKLILQGDRNLLVYDKNSPENSYCIAHDDKINCSLLLNNTLYVGTEHGMRILDGDRLIGLIGTENLEGTRIRGILNGDEGLLIITSTKGVYSYSYGSIKKLPYYDEDFGEVFAYAINGDYLALGTIGHGVLIINLMNGETVKYDEQNGLISNTVLSLEFDFNGNLWIGHDGGVEQLFIEFPLKTLSNSKLPIGYGYVSKLIEDKLWIGTNRGLYSLSFPIKYPLRFNQTPTIEGQVWNIRELSGSFYLCHDHGLYKFDGNNNWAKIEDIYGVWDIQNLTNDRNLALVGTYDGLYLIDLSRGNGNRQQIRKIEGYSGSPYNFFQENDSTIWTCEGTGGILRLIFDVDKGRILRSQRFTVAGDGTTLVGHLKIGGGDNRPLFLTDNGIYHYDKSSGQIVIDKRITDLINSRYRCVNLKKKGNLLYVLTDHELIRVNLLTKEHAILPLHDEWMISRHYGDMLEILDESHLMLPSMKGLTFASFDHGKFDAKKLSINPGKINAFYSTSLGDSLLYQSNYLNLKNNVILDFDHNSIKFLFGNDKLSNENLIQYRYRLNDEQWSDASFVTVKEFTALREGEYTFTVQGLFNNEVIAEDSMDFTILPPWYKTKWAFILYFVLICGIGMLIYFLTKNSLNKQRQKIIQRSEEKLLNQKRAFEEEERKKNEQIELLERENLQNEFNLKTQEITNLLINEANKNEILIDLKEGLKAIMKSSTISSDNRRLIAILQEKINVGLNGDKALKKAEEEFNVLYNNFTLRLRKEYPTLSNNEVMLCSYLKMNLSSKEIAPLMNISIRGIETMRYRLRKKMGLEREDSLSSFIANFN